MINLNKKDSLASKVEEILQQEALKGKQHKIDKNHNNKIDSQDFKILRGEKKVAEEIDVKDKTEDDLTGRKKVTNKDDVGPSSNFKPSKVRFHAGPDNNDDSETVIPADKNKAAENKKLKMGEEVEQIEEKEKWIQGAIKKPGALHKQLGVPADEKIPASKLKAAAEKGGKLGKRANLAMTLKKFKEEYEENSIYDQMIQEVLSKDASAGDWIHDFVHSDNPKFAGKSKEKRKQMALAAYYAKQRNEEVETDICPDCMQDPCVCGGNHIEEEVEQIDELKTDTVHSYYKKAFAQKYAHKLGTGEKPSKETLQKRNQGMKRAEKRFDASNPTKGAGTPASAGNWYKQGRYMGDSVEIPDDVQQIDEISKSTLGSYVKSAARDIGASRKLAADFQNQADKSRKPGSKAASSSLSKKFMATAQKRHAGIGKAVERLTKEESEQVEENAFDWKKPRPPESKGGAGVKAGRAYGGAAQKSKPEHDDADDKKKVQESKRPESDTVPFVTNENTPLNKVKQVAKQAMKRVKNEMLGKTGTSE
jgi:hypothetical protein